VSGAGGPHSGLPDGGVLDPATGGRRGPGRRCSSPAGQQPGRAQQQSGAGGLAQDGGDELLLALDAAQVAAVAEGVPGAHERQRLLAVDVAHPGRQVQPAHDVDGGAGQADVDPTERADHGLEAGEVHLDVVVDPDPGQRLDGGHRAAAAALGERGVELVVHRGMNDAGGVRAGRDGHVGVSRDADQQRPAPAAERWARMAVSERAPPTKSAPLPWNWPLTAPARLSEPISRTVSALPANLSGRLERLANTLLRVMLLV
jgi:hypothetical protein